MSNYDVAIIGAGPAGMMAAITASGNGKRVVLVERNPQLGRKLLATGNGRCNLTNAVVTLDRFHGGDTKLVESVLNQFDQPATLKLFADLGLILKEEADGRIFPRTNQASSVVEVLRQRLARNRVDILLDAQVTAIEQSPTWTVSLADGKSIQSDRLIIATGGRAAHYLGSTGDGLYWAQKLGHFLTPIYAALVPIETVEEWPRDAQGIKVEAVVWATSGGKKINESKDDLLFTSYGISGPAAMALAGSIAPLLKNCEVKLHIDLFPDMAADQLDQSLARTFANDGGKTVAESLIGFLPSGLIPVVLNLASVSPSSKLAAMPKAKRLELVATMKDMVLTVSKLRPPKEAQVSAGGINSEEVDPLTLQSKLVKGLYFAGEILDVDGDSGGFNLQWAWSSGYVAGLLAD